MNQEFSNDGIKCRFFMRSKTNNGEFAKQYFTLVRAGKGSEAVIIRKLILSEDVELYGGHSRTLRSFRGKHVFEQCYSIKVGTLRKALMAIDKFNALSLPNDGKYRQSGSRRSDTMARALHWWNSMPMQNLRGRHGWANLVMKYYPHKTDCQDVSVEEILYMYVLEEELNN